MDSYNSWRRLALFAMSCATAMAQVDTGTISGIVTDSSGAIVPGAQVRVTQQETNVHLTLPTNEAGFFSAPALPPATTTSQFRKRGSSRRGRPGSNCACKTGWR